MLNWSARAGELGGQPGPALFPLPKGYPHVWQPSEMTGPVGPRGPGGPSDPRGPRHSLWRGGAPTMKIPRTPRGAGEPRGWPDSREGGLGPGQGRDTRNGNAPWVRLHFHIHGGIPMYGSRVQ